MTTKINAISTETRIPTESSTATKQTENITVDFTSNSNATNIDEAQKAIARIVESYEKQIKVLEQKLYAAKKEYEHMEMGLSKGLGAFYGGMAGTVAGFGFVAPIVESLFVVSGPIAWGAALLGGVLTTAGGAAYGYYILSTPESEAKHQTSVTYYNNVIKPLELEIDNLYKAMREEMDKLK